MDKFYLNLNINIKGTYLIKSADTRFVFTIVYGIKLIFDNLYCKFWNETRVKFDYINFIIYKQYKEGIILFT